MQSYKNDKSVFPSTATLEKNLYFIHSEDYM